MALFRYEDSSNEKKILLWWNTWRVHGFEDNNKAIEDLSLEELKSFSATFEEDIYEFIDYENILNKGIKKNLK